MGLFWVASFLWPSFGREQAGLLWDRLAPWVWHQKVHVLHWSDGVVPLLVIGGRDTGRALRAACCWRVRSSSVFRSLL
jgi:hypothetical protein